MDFKNLAKVTYSDQLILTTEQLAEFYGCTTDNIKKNFNANKDRFIEGKHYFKVEGENLNYLRVTFGNLQISPMTRLMYLWTKKGAARHAKMLSTEKAWEVFELLEEAYFESKEKIESASKVENAVAVQNLTPVPEYHKIVKIIDKTAMQIVKCFGTKYGIAFANVASMIEENHGVNLSKIKSLIPPADYEIGMYTPTQIGKKIGKSAQYVNKKLAELGFQVKDGNGYKLTDAGKEYAEAMPFERNGHTGYQIKWTAEILKFFE